MGVSYTYFFKSFINEVWFKLLNNFVSTVLAAAAYLLWIAFARKTSIHFSLMSLRYNFNAVALDVLKKALKESKNLIDEKITSDVQLGEASDRTIVLKWPVFNGAEHSKGILLIKFTRTFSFYLNHIDIEKLNSYFHVVLEPSWSGYADPDILCWIGRAKNIVIQSSEAQDRILMNCFPETFIPVSFGSGCWVPLNDFSLQPIDKVFDSIYIANNNPIKRVHRYINAIKNIVNDGNADYKACLVCSSWGGEDDLVKSLIKKSGVERNITLKFSLTRVEVAQHLNMSKCNILLSYKEGSNRSLFESMFCNVPVICISENIGVDKSCINEFTGLLVPDATLEESLLWLSNNFNKFLPKAWAEKNISPTATKNKLVEIINSRAGDCIISESVFSKVNAPEASYMDKIDFKSRSFNEELLAIFEKERANDDDKINRIESLSLRFNEAFSRSA